MSRSVAALAQWWGNSGRALMRRVGRIQPASESQFGLVVHCDDERHAGQEREGQYATIVRRPAGYVLTQPPPTVRVPHSRKQDVPLRCGVR